MEATERKVWSDELIHALGDADCDDPTTWPAELREKYETRRRFQVGETRIDSTDELKWSLLAAAMDRRGQPAWWLATEILGDLMARHRGEPAFSLFNELENALSVAYYMDAPTAYLELVPRVLEMVPATCFDGIVDMIAGVAPATLPQKAIEEWIEAAPFMAAQDEPDPLPYARRLVAGLRYLADEIDQVVLPDENSELYSLGIVVQADLLDDAIRRSEAPLTVA